MEIEMLHISKGDKKKKIDTSTEKGRQEAQTYVEKLIRQGTAIFVERGKKTYRVKGFDVLKDRLVVEIEKAGKKKSVTTKSSKAVAVAPAAGG